MNNYPARWKFICDKLDKIKDPILRNVVRAQLAERARREWGFDPTDSANKKKIKNAAPILDPWEQKFSKAIDAAITYGVKPSFIGEEAKEARANMMDFVRHGGMLSEIPDYIRCDAIDNLYYDCLESVHRDTIAAADNFIQNYQNNTKTDDDLIQNSD